MEENVTLLELDDCISLGLSIEADEIIAIGEKMEEINEEAYMNGYNWEAFFNYYFEKNHPELFKIMQPDPEAGAYFVVFEKSNENMTKVKQIESIMIDLLNNPDKIYQCMKDNDGEIEWD